MFCRRNIPYSTHPQNAESIDELISNYKDFFALINLLYKETTAEKIEDTKKVIKQSINAYLRAKELGEVLNVQLSPKKIIEEEDNDFILEKMYLLLVKKRIIRKNDKLNHIEVANVEKMEIGQELFATYIKHGDLEIYEEHKDIYVVNCVIGAKIEKVEKKEDGGNIVYFVDSERNPMYITCSAFLNKEEAEDEMKKIFDKREEYFSARHWMDQVKDLFT